MQAHNHAYVVPTINWSNTINKELPEDWSRESELDLTTEFAGHEWTVEFPVMIDCTSQVGRDDEHGVARQRRSRDTLFIDTPRQARKHYSKRFGIEATYRLSESSLISTTATDQTRRLLFVVISLLLQNVWRYLHWEYVATPRRGGCRLWWWTFEEFSRMITRAAWNALSVRRSIPANQLPDDRFERLSPSKQGIESVETLSCRRLVAVDCDSSFHHLMGLIINFQLYRLV